MGLFSSKTKYYVSSSTFPLFNPDQRINGFEAAMLDYTSNSTLEQYEYLKNYYDTSRLRDIRGLINWADRSGYHNTMGKISTLFYGDAQFDNNTVTAALKQYVSVSANQTLQVYATSLNRFSEDFWLKHLATQQGKANLFFEGTGVDYTVDFPTTNTIRATFSNGQVVQGSIPDQANTYRYLEICYSIETSTQTTVNGTIVTNITYSYGYYDYRENSGSAAFDTLIKNNGIVGTKSFYPVIPIRTDTAWFTGTNATHINNILKQLHLYKRNELLTTTPYEKLKATISEGISKSGNGSLGDIDYMTIILGIPINTRNSSDARYLFEFFYNLYANYSLMKGNVPQVQSAGVSVYSGKGALRDYFNELFTNLGYSRTTTTRSGKSFFSWVKRNSYVSEDYGFSKFNIYNAKSNLNLTYDWGHAGYFEANGKWKPNAKISECGVLAGLYRHTWTQWDPKTDSEGNIIYHETSSGQYEPVYELNTYSCDINLVLFCKQTSTNRWKFVLFSGLSLQNLVYHGKSVYTDAYADVKDSSQTTQLEHNFTEDSDGTYDDYKIFSFKYVEEPGDGNSAFIVPLEQNTFYEIGVPAELDISYGCQNLICNCWVKKKVKWYNRGWFSVALSFVGMSLTWWSPTAWTYFAVIFTVTLTAKALELLNKICVTIFGESFGNSVYKALIIVVKVVLQILATIFFYLGNAIPIFYIFWAICIVLYATITAAEYVRQGYDLWDAVKAGVIEGTGAAIGSMGAALGGVGAGASGAAGSTAGAAAGSTASGIAGTIGNVGIAAATSFASTFVTTAGNAWLNGESFGSAFRSGLKQGVIAGVASGLFKGMGNLYNGHSFLGTEVTSPGIDIGLKDNINESIANNGLGSTVGTLAVGALKYTLTNPNTYAKLISATAAERIYHKLANMENDYQEFNNKLGSAYKSLNVMNFLLNSLLTAELVAVMQACIGKQTTEGNVTDIDPEAWLTQATATGHDQLKIVLCGPSFFVDNKLSVLGYTPYPLHYTQQDFDLVFTESLQIT